MIWQLFVIVLCCKIKRWTSYLLRKRSDGCPVSELSAIRTKRAIRNEKSEYALNVCSA